MSEELSNERDENRIAAVLVPSMPTRCRRICALLDALASAAARPSPPELLLLLILFLPRRRLRSATLRPSR